MNKSKDKRRVIFLIAGVIFAVISTAAWIADWYLPETQPGNDVFIYISLVTYMLSFITIVIWLTRLNNNQLMTAVVFFLIASVLTYALTQFLKANHIEFFSFSRELFREKLIEEYDPRYVTNWGILFLYPYLFMLNAAMVFLFLLALMIWAIKRSKETKALKNAD